jgi:early secretory antigenic target protein ESAT-6
MAEQIQLDAATLHKAATDVRTTRGEVNGDLGRLWNTVDDLAIAWQGEASAGFQQLMNRWNDDVKKLLTAMDDIADLLDKSGTQHEVNDQEQSQMMNRYNSALNP